MVLPGFVNGISPADKESHNGAFFGEVGRCTTSHSLFSLSVSLSLTHTQTHTLSFTFSLPLTHALVFSLSLSLLSHTISHSFSLSLSLSLSHSFSLSLSLLSLSLSSWPAPENFRKKTMGLKWLLPCDFNKLRDHNGVFYLQLAAEM